MSEKLKKSAYFDSNFIQTWLQYFASNKRFWLYTTINKILASARGFAHIVPGSKVA